MDSSVPTSNQTNLGDGGMWRGHQNRPGGCRSLPLSPFMTIQIFDPTHLSISSVAVSALLLTVSGYSYLEAIIAKSCWDRGCIGGLLRVCPGE